MALPASAHTDRIGLSREAYRAKKGGDGFVSQKPPEMRRFWVITYPYESESRPLPGPLEPLGAEEMRQTAPVNPIGCILSGSRGGKMEISE